jgi:hypothetical protein
LIVSPEWNEPSGEEAFPSPVKNDLLWLSEISHDTAFELNRPLQFTDIAA